MAGPVVALVACGAPLAARMHEIAAALVAADWSVSPLATAEALPWIDVTQVENVTGREIRTRAAQARHRIEIRSTGCGRGVSRDVQHGQQARRRHR